MTEAEVSTPELEALWRRLSEECLLLQGKVERADAGRAGAAVGTPAGREGT